MYNFTAAELVFSRLKMRRNWISPMNITIPSLSTRMMRCKKEKISLYKDVKQVFRCLIWSIFYAKSMFFQRIYYNNTALPIFPWEVNRNKAVLKEYLVCNNHGWQTKEFWAKFVSVLNTFQKNNVQEILVFNIWSENQILIPYVNDHLSVSVGTFRIY